MMNITMIMSLTYLESSNEHAIGTMNMFIGTLSQYNYDDDVIM